MNPLLDFSESLLDSFEKTAAELDLRVAEVDGLRLEVQALKAAASIPLPPTTPALDKGILTKLATQLDREGLLLENMTVEGAINAMVANPNLIAKLAFSLVTPVTEGVAIAPHKQSPVGKEAHLVEFDGRMFKDPDGMLATLG